MNSRELEDKYLGDIIGVKARLLSLSTESFHKYKFTLISNLVSDLFKYKDSKESYEAISNLIITSLTSMDNKSPVDIFSGKKDLKIKSTLKKEFVTEEFLREIVEYHKTITLGRKIHDLFTNFAKKFQVIENIEIHPRIRDNGYALVN